MIISRENDKKRTDGDGQTDGTHYKGPNYGSKNQFIKKNQHVSKYNTPYAKDDHEEETHTNNNSERYEIQL